MKCEFCDMPITDDCYVRTGKSDEVLCISCADEVDDTGYDINEV